MAPSPQIKETCRPPPTPPHPDVPPPQCPYSESGEGQAGSPDVPFPDFAGPEPDGQGFSSAREEAEAWPIITARTGGGAWGHCSLASKGLHPHPTPAVGPRRPRVGGPAVFNLSSRLRRLRDVRLALRSAEIVCKSKKF